MDIEPVEQKRQDFLSLRAGAGVKVTIKISELAIEHTMLHTMLSKLRVPMLFHQALFFGEMNLRVAGQVGEYLLQRLSFGSRIHRFTQTVDHTDDPLMLLIYPFIADAISFFPRHNTHTAPMINCIA